MSSGWHTSVIIANIGYICSFLTTLAIFILFNFQSAKYSSTIYNETTKKHKCSYNCVKNISNFLNDNHTYVILSKLSRITMICFLTYLFLMCFYTISYGFNFELSTNILLVLYILLYILDAIGIMSILLFYIYRLKATFDDSAYKISKRLLMIYFILSLIWFFFTIFALCVDLLMYFLKITNHHDHDHSNDLTDYLGVSIRLIGALFAGFEVCSIAYLFSSKLMNLVISQRQTIAVNILMSQIKLKNNQKRNNINITSIKSKFSLHANNTTRNSSNITKSTINSDESPLTDSETMKSNTTNITNICEGNENENNIEHPSCYNYDYVSKLTTESILSQRQLSLLKSITKQTVLIVFGILFIFFDFVFVGCQVFSRTGNSNNSSLWLVWLMICIEWLEYTMVPIVLWLSFVFSNKQYFIICGCCHKYCGTCCTNVALYKLKKSLLEPTDAEKENDSKLFRVRSVELSTKPQYTLMVDDNE